VIGKQDAYFVRHHSDSPYKYSEADIKGMLGFGDQVFQQSVALAFLWAQIVLLYWQIYPYIHMKQNLFRNSYRIITKTSHVLQPYILDISMMSCPSTIILFTIMST
jgi:hypothetical protein